MMEVGQVKVAEDKDFENLKLLVDNHKGWKLDYSKSNINVWTKNVSNTNFKMIKVAYLSIFHSLIGSNENYILLNKNDL